ncbi:hypothetical protein QUD39_03865 [Staphylococcus hyicus]|uniref:hypothetical protein n=1 Tax=Staphylococcus hyicus TaxID=1284 RepID=UPI002738646A|nr:hypothetical protein [Staphylococcus hyicus]MDP4460406.1 hypothetical protein [Staphylococcus hyicus]
MTDYKAERDTLIADIAKLRAERDEYKRKLDDVWYQEGDNEYRLSHEITVRGLVKEGSKWNEEDK